MTVRVVILPFERRSKLASKRCSLNRRAMSFLFFNWKTFTDGPSANNMKQIKNFIKKAPIDRDLNDFRRRNLKSHLTPGKIMKKMRNKTIKVGKKYPCLLNN